MALVNISSPHTTRGSGAGSVMLHVILATVPGFLALTWQFGGGVAINVVLAVRRWCCACADARSCSTCAT